TVLVELAAVLSCIEVSGLGCGERLSVAYATYPLYMRGDSFKLPCLHPSSQVLSCSYCASAAGKVNIRLTERPENWSLEGRQHAQRFIADHQKQHDFSGAC